MKFELQSKTNKDKSSESIEIFPPLLLKPPYICARAMPRAQKRSAKGSSVKEDESALSL